MAIALADLLEKAKAYLPEAKIGVLEEAYAYAEAKHAGKNRDSGEPFIAHPLSTALYLTDLHQDPTTIAAGLLHDVVEDCGVPLPELEARFGPEVARLVDGVTKLNKIDLLAEDREGDEVLGESHAHAESIRKMLVAMAEDIRVVLIKLCDRLHNMRTLEFKQPPGRRQVIAQETLDIYAPLAHRLGIWDIKWQLEDLGFRHVDEKTYREISRSLAVRRVEREEYLERQCAALRTVLQEAGVKGEVYGRPKNIYSIYKKMQKYAAEGKEYREILDLYAIRVLVDTVSDCYATLGIVHQIWRPISGQFDDYIANPKENRYQSIHTSVMCEGAVPLEVQVRTYEMHRMSEYGVAAHWSYKDGNGDRQFEEKLTWLRQLLEWQREVSGTDEFLESVRTDILRDQVYVYTPKGEVREMPVGATSIDFAYRIHSELGHRCIGAKVNGRLVPLETPLQNGDTVEIITSKQARGPSMDWLNSTLEYATTASARQKIRQWFRRQERGAWLDQGREILARTRRRLSLAMTDAEIARGAKHDTIEDLLAALGSGNLTIAQLEARLAPPEESAPHAVPPGLPPESPATGIQVLGVGDLLTHTARCCTPVPGDQIVGYVTRSRGVTVHRATCSNVLNEDEPERLIGVTWGPSRDLHPIRAEVIAWDRMGLLRDVTTLVSAEKVNIASVVTTEPEDGTAIITLTLYTTGVSQLSRLFSKLEGVKGVVGVKRIGSVARVT